MNEKFDIALHMSSMTDADLLEAVDLARSDLLEAARDEPESERHQECFAAAILYTAEAGKRGLKLSTIH